MGAGEEGSNHIVHLTTVHHPRDPRISHKQIPTLEENGFETTLVVSGRPEQIPSSLSTVSLSPARSRFQRLMLQGSVYRKALALDADAYHVHDPELIPLAFGLRAATGAVVVYDMHEDYCGRQELTGRLLRGLERWCFSWVDHVIVAEQKYESILVGESVPYTFVGNYYKPYEEEPSPLPSTSPPWHLLYTGSIANHRGLSTMLRLAARLKEMGRSDVMTLVGIYRRAEERRRAERFIREKGIEPLVQRIGWTDYVPASEMGPFYREADVGLALFEPTPNHKKSLLTKFYEYLHYGLPIICSNFPLWREFVEENDCGAVVPPGDPDAVLEVLDQWRERPERYRTCAQNARSAASRYRWEKMGERLVRLYRDLLARREPAQ